MCMTIAVGGNNQGSLESTRYEREGNSSLQSTAKIKSSGVCCWRRACPIVWEMLWRESCGDSYKIMASYGTRILILRAEQRRKRRLIQKARITREHKVKKEIRSTTSSSIVQTVGSQPTGDWLYSNVYTLDRFEYMRLFLCSLLKPYWGNQQGVCLHFICCEPLERLQCDL